MSFFRYLVIAVLVSLSGMKADAMNAGELKCEYRVNPLGIDETRPRLSWVLEGTGRGLHQSACHILVASTAEVLAQDKGDLWDSGKLESDQNVQVRYGGAPLASGARCHWKVRAWDKSGLQGEWSKPAFWTMGLLKPSDWQAKWIGRDEQTSGVEQLLANSNWIWFPEGEPAKAAPVGTVWFRRALSIDPARKLKRAICQASADNSCIVYVNGIEVGKGTSFNAAIVLNITSHLKPGNNTLAIAGSNVGGSPNPAGLIAAVKIEYESGEGSTLVTDTSWHTTNQQATGWEQPQHDDSTWKPAMVAVQYGKAPWGEIKAMDNDRRLASRMLRREFSTPKPVQQATAYVCGLGLFELYLNGDRISDNVLQPALTDYGKQAQYVTFDVTGNLKQGANAVGVWLGNGRYFAPRLGDPVPTRTFGYPKVLMQLEVLYADGTSERIVSDENWRLTTKGPIEANNEYDGEEYDARREMPDWSKAGFDASAWEKVQVVQAPAGELKARMIEPIRVVETLKPIGVTEPVPGTFIVDMGQNLVGWCRLKVTGDAGKQIQLRHAETLTTKGLLYLDNIRAAKVTDVYTLKGGGEEVYEPRFTYHGFRYVEVTGWPGKPTPDSFEGRVVHDDMAKGGSFMCSNDLLNRIYKNIIWGTRGNYRSIPTDCPQRDERQGWLGDRSEECRGESYLYNVAAFYAKWVRDMQDSQKPSGSIPDVAPNYWEFYGDGVVWPSSFVIIPHTMYTQYGDRSIIESHYDGMKSWMNYMTAALKDDIMTSNTYGDWCVPPEDPKLIHSEDPKRQTNPALISTCYFFHDSKLMASMARLLGKADDATHFDLLAERLKVAFNKKFLNKDTGIYDNGSQTASVLPLAFGLVPDEHKRTVFDRLVHKIEKETHGHIGTGLVGGQWLMRVLSDNGRADIAYGIATKNTYPSWGYMLEKGATTIWELWNGDTADPAMNSGNHVMLIGDLNIWFTEYLAGIRPEVGKPGFKSFTVRPFLAGDLTSASAEVNSIHGKIVSSWKRENGNALRLNVTVPPNTVATVYVPAKNADAVTEGDGPAAKAAGVTFVRMDKDAAVYQVGSGEYAFSVK